MHEKTEKMAPEIFQQVANTIRVLGHAQRLQIIECLDLHGERSVNEIVAAVNGQQSAVSQHLIKMRAAGLLGVRRAGRQVFYRITAKSPLIILNCIRQQFQ